MIFLANENFPLSSIKLLRKKNYKIVSVIEEMPGTKDLDILQRAQKENLIVLTFDRDYGELLYRHKKSFPKGVVYFRFTPANPEEPANILCKILDEGKIPLLDKFTVIDRIKIRQKNLL